MWMFGSRTTVKKVRNSLTWFSHGSGATFIEVATDNEGYLKDLMAQGLTKSNMRSFHWRNISEYRPQAKGIEGAVGIAKEGIYTNWLAFEEHCQCRIALESPLLGYLIGYVYRTFDIFCEQRQSGTPLEKMRGARGGQKPSSHPFGMIGFVKPVLLDPWKGHRMVLSVYLGMRYVTGVPGSEHWGRQCESPWDCQALTMLLIGKDPYGRRSHDKIRALASATKSAEGGHVLITHCTRPIRCIKFKAMTTITGQAALNSKPVHHSNHFSQKQVQISNLQLKMK